MKNKTEKVIFKKLNLKKDITTKYQNWMNDPKINEYTEQDHKKHSLNDIRKFVRDKTNLRKIFYMGFL